jgi:glutamyl-tRNA reductase
MPVIALGLNHKTAPLAVREQFAFAADHVPAALHTLVQSTRLSEAAILSTCNRTEIYCAETNVAETIAWLTEEKSQHKQYLYTLTGDQAVRHMMRVASGLDSLILGEPQILGQLKSAYSLAQQAGTIGHILDRLFQTVFSAAKNVRADTAIGEKPVSVAYAAAKLATRIFTDLKSTPVLLIGTGEMSQLAAKHLRDWGVQKIYLATRSPSEAFPLAEKMGAQIITHDQIPSYLKQVDIVISATGSRIPIIQKNMVADAVKARKHRPLLLVDLAVPRDIDAEVADLKDIFLYTVDDLDGIVQEGLSHRQAAAQEAEFIIDQHVTDFMNWIKLRKVTDVLADFRERVHNIRDEELTRAQHAIANGQNVQEVLTRMANTLTNKFLHGPTVLTRQATLDDDPHIVDAVMRLFTIEKNS